MDQVFSPSIYGPGVKHEGHISNVCLTGSGMISIYMGQLVKSKMSQIEILVMSQSKIKYTI